MVVNKDGKVGRQGSYSGKPDWENKKQTKKAHSEL